MKISNFSKLPRILTYHPMTFVEGAKRDGKAGLKGNENAWKWLYEFMNVGNFGNASRRFLKKEKKSILFNPRGMKWKLKICYFNW